ncbi:hypothetical protein SK128_017584, partial [Halocaridina rubra]
MFTHISTDGSSITPVVRSRSELLTFNSFPIILKLLPRSRKRLIELLAKTGLEGPKPRLSSVLGEAKEWELRFLQSPVEILPTVDGQG